MSGRPLRRAREQMRRNGDDDDRVYWDATWIIHEYSKGLFITTDHRHGIRSVRMNAGLATLSCGVGLIGLKRRTYVDPHPTVGEFDYEDPLWRKKMKASMDYMDDITASHQRRLAYVLGLPRMKRDEFKEFFMRNTMFLCDLEALMLNEILWAEELEEIERRKGKR